MRRQARLVRAMIAGAVLAGSVSVAGCGGAPGPSSAGRPGTGSAGPATASGSVAPPADRASPPAIASAASPPKSATGVSAPLSLGAVAGKVIVIDPGHNGGNAAHAATIRKPVPMGTGTKPCDTTGTETNGGYQEAAFTFDVSTRLAAVLRTAGARVVLTRTDNTGFGPCVNQRAAIGNDSHASVAVSIHADGAPASGHGFHVLEPARLGAPSDVIISASHRLALAIRDNYRARTGIPASNYIGRDGINTRGDMGGLNLSVVPKVMVECGNMRNAGDAAMITSATYRQRMAEGLAAGLAAYLAG